MLAPGPLQCAHELRRLALLAAGVLVAVYLLGVRTAVGQAWGDAAYLGRLAEAKGYRTFDKRLLEAIDIRVFLLGAVVLLALAGIRRHWRAGFLITGSFLAAILSAEILKLILTRPILAPGMEALMGEKQGLNTFPSGHATFITGLVLGSILLVPRAARPWVAMIGIGAIIAVTGGVVTAGWHRPSDALAGIALGTIWLSLGAALVVRRDAAPVPVPSAMRLVPYAGAAIAALGTILTLAMLMQPDALPLLTLKVAIFGWAVTVVTLYASILSGVDLARD